MNIIPLHKKNHSLPQQPRALFEKMSASLKNAGASMQKTITLAKTLAPLLCDTTSNARHLAVIDDKHASSEDKVLAIIMLGFPSNRLMLPTLQKLLLKGEKTERLAAAIAISQMAKRDNLELIAQILEYAWIAESDAELKQAIKKLIPNLPAPTEATSKESLPSPSKEVLRTV